MCCYTKLARQVRKFYKKYSLLVYGVVGIILSVIVIIDMGMKLDGGSGIAWSPLRILGPTVWLPLKVTADKLMAAQTLVHSLMYIIACYYLVQALGQENKLLMGPWLVMHCFFMTYQIVLVIRNSHEYPIKEVMLGFSDLLLQVILLVTAYLTGMRWTPRARRRGAADIPAETGHQPLDPNSDERPSYDSWPWLWIHEAWVAATAAADPSSADIEMQSLDAMSDAEPPTSEAAAVMAAEAALHELEESGAEVVHIVERAESGAEVVGIVEPEESGAEVVAVAEPRTSEAETEAAGESQMSGGGEEPRASHTGWFDRRWLQTAEQLPGGGCEQASAGGSDTATEHPLLQPSH